MASAGDEDAEYESDPEEAKRSLAMRRRQAASDDEEEGEEERGKVDGDRKAEVRSDESDGQGGIEEYDDDDDGEYVDDYDDDGEYVEDYDDIDYQEAGVERVEEVNPERGGGVVKESNAEGVRKAEAVEEGEEGKKENEPFAVPTAGSFYMHDDRFKDNAGRRGRRTRGGRRLWESKDELKWGHDKFEEMNMPERQYDEQRRSFRGRYRGRGKSGGSGRGYSRGDRSRTYDINDDQNQGAKSMRGRGRRRYDRARNNSSQAPPAQNKQSRKPTEKNLHSSLGTAFTTASNVDSEHVSARKQVSSSSLSSASPPFYPSGSLNKDVTITQKRDLLTVDNSKNLHPDASDDNIAVAQSNTLIRGKNVVDSVGVERLSVDDSATHAAGKNVASLKKQALGSSVSGYSQSSQFRFQGKGAVNTKKMSYQPVQHHNQVTRVPTSSGVRVQNGVQTPQQFGQHPVNKSEASSPPNVEAGKIEYASESDKSKGAIVGKGKSSVQVGGRGSFMYNGAHIMGAAANSSVGHGDQNFSNGPAFLPVMQFGGQHPGGVGVPTFGMAFPGYLGGNSEMTWLPVLAGPSGALGGAYCPHQIAMDGSYYARPAGQSSSVASSNNDSNTSNPSNGLKPSQRSEMVNDEVGERQNKPRRYSEMKFGQ